MVNSFVSRTSKSRVRQLKPRPARTGRPSPSAATSGPTSESVGGGNRGISPPIRRVALGSSRASTCESLGIRAGRWPLHQKQGPSRVGCSRVSRARDPSRSSNARRGLTATFQKLSRYREALGQRGGLPRLRRQGTHTQCRFVEGAACEGACATGGREFVGSGSGPFGDPNRCWRRPGVHSALPASSARPLRRGLPCRLGPLRRAGLGRAGHGRRRMAREPRHCRGTPPSDHAAGCSFTVGADPG